MKKWIFAVVPALLLLLILCLFACDGTGKEENTGTVDAPEQADTSGMDFDFTDRDMSGTESGGTELSVGQIITAEGVYRLTGNVSGPVVIDAGEAKIQLVLENATISCSDGPAIYVKSGDKVFLTLAGENTVTDGSAYADAYINDGVDGVIFSRADLTINGEGSLTVNSAYKHGIVSKDDLVIAGGTITVDAPNVALHGKDCVKVTACILNLTAGTDGIRSDNTEDATRGYVYIKDGTVNIEAGTDGIQAATVVNCETPTVNIKATGKGIKATSDILISGGSYTVVSTDDCVHSNNTISISGGVLTLTSKDDGVHADTDLAVSGGEITVMESYEGIEASKILISGGKLDVTASDDGLNAAGGNDGSSVSGRPGQGMFSSSTGEIQIGGGYILINASGDGVDSNGPILLSGGVVLVSGPTNSGNGAFDCDGTATVTGGCLLAAGSNGMAQGFSSAENQGAALCSFGTLQAGTSFAVCDSDGNVVISFTPKKNYASAAITAPGIQLNETYTVIAGGTVSGADENGFASSGTVTGGTTLGTFTMTSLVMGSGGGGPGGNPGGNPGGRPHR